MKGNITFTDGHTIDEFDTIKFVYGLIENNKPCTILEEEFSKNTLNFAIEKGNQNVNYLIELNGFGNRNIGICNIQKNKITIGCYIGYHLFMIYGVNYK